MKKLFATYTKLHLTKDLMLLRNFDTSTTFSIMVHEGPIDAGEKAPELLQRGQHKN